jgi:hypothetical protein
MEPLPEIETDLGILAEKLRGEQELVLEIELGLGPPTGGVVGDGRPEEGQGPGMPELAPGPQGRDDVLGLKALRRRQHPLRVLFGGPAVLGDGERFVEELERLRQPPVVGETDVAPAAEGADQNGLEPVPSFFRSIPRDEEPGQFEELLEGPPRL